MMWTGVRLRSGFVRRDRHTNISPAIPATSRETGPGSGTALISIVRVDVTRGVLHVDIGDVRPERLRASGVPSGKLQKYKGGFFIRCSFQHYSPDSLLQNR